ncbi:MAG: hypothetical protein IJ786_03240 [Bacteroidaceae bacterium]|nr:hypothetical protein [Bacteroidaceae bacterium]
MKKLLSILTFLTLFVMTMPAQQVYDMVLDNATRTVNNPTSNFTQVKIAQFKKTALTYMRQQEAADSIIDFRVLDFQAYYLNQFLTLYLREFINYSAPNKGDMLSTVVKLFIKASLDCPMWNDPDTETTQAYIGDNEELTPFSIDTDWQKAYEEVQILLNQLPNP